MSSLHYVVGAAILVVGLIFLCKAIARTIRVRVVQKKVFESASILLSFERFGNAMGFNHKGTGPISSDSAYCLTQNGCYSGKVTFAKWVRDTVHHEGLQAFLPENSKLMVIMNGEGEFVTTIWKKTKKD